MKKLFSLMIALTMIAAVFAGCAQTQPGAEASATPSATATAAPSESAAPTATPAPEPVTLKWIGAGWLANEKADTLISRFKEQNPNIDVQYTELSNLVDENYLKNLDIMIASGEEIDLTYLGSTDLLVRAQSGAATPINDAIAKAGDDFVKDYTELAKTMLSINGQIYGVPYANNTFKVFYNKTMTDAKGITIPKEWSIQEFTEIAKKLNDPAKKVWGCIFPSTWSDLCYAAAEVSGWTMVKKDASGKFVPNFDDPTFRASMQWVADLGLKDKVSPTYATIKSESLNRRVALASGQTAMIVDGPYTLVFLQKYMFDDPGAGPLSFELGVTELPYINEQGKNASFLSLVGAFWFPKTCKYLDQAYQFARFICNGNFDKGTYMPVYTGADMQSATKTLTTCTDSKGTLHENIYPYETALAAVTCPHESYISYYKNDPEIYAKYVPPLYTLFNEQYTTFVNGEVTLDQFVANMQSLGAAELANVK